MHPQPWTRRSFLLAAAAAAAASAAPAPARKKIALIGTVVSLHSHAQHFLDRLALGYTWGGKWQPPQADLVSLYVDQFPAKDLARSRAKKYGIPIFPSIADALTLGTGQLAVDGVVIIGEHGDYPRNAIGQVLYPRFETFAQIVSAFYETKQTAPVYVARHLSHDFDRAKQMVAWANELDFPLLAGSPLPFTARSGELDLPRATPLLD